MKRNRKNYGVIGLLGIVSLGAYAACGTGTSGGPNGADGETKGEERRDANRATLALRFTNNAGNAWQFNGVNMNASAVRAGKSHILTSARNLIYLQEGLPKDQLGSACFDLHHWKQGGSENEPEASTNICVPPSAIHYHPSVDPLYNQTPVSPTPAVATATPSPVSDLAVIDLAQAAVLTSGGVAVDRDKFLKTFDQDIFLVRLKKDQKDVTSAWVGGYKCDNKVKENVVPNTFYDIRNTKKEGTVTIAFDLSDVFTSPCEGGGLLSQGLTGAPAYRRVDNREADKLYDSLSESPFAENIVLIAVLSMFSNEPYFSRVDEQFATAPATGIREQDDLNNIGIQPLPRSWLLEKLGLGPNPGSPIVLDVKSFSTEDYKGSKYKADIDEAISRGIVVGTKPINGNQIMFSPQQVLTRQQLAVVLVKALKSYGPLTSLPKPCPNNIPAVALTNPAAAVSGCIQPNVFTDGASITWSAEQVYTAAALHLFDGLNGFQAIGKTPVPNQQVTYRETLLPNKKVTYGELKNVLTGMLNKGAKPGTPLVTCKLPTLSNGTQLAADTIEVPRDFAVSAVLAAVRCASGSVQLGQQGVDAKTSSGDVIVPVIVGNDRAGGSGGAGGAPPIFGIMGAAGGSLIAQTPTRP